jgi:hypothetical protein
MITGLVRGGEARIRLTVRGPRGREEQVEAVVDTGYTAWLTLLRPAVAALGKAPAAGRRPRDQRGNERHGFRISPFFPFIGRDGLAPAGSGSTSLDEEAARIAKESEAAGKAAGKAGATVLGVGLVTFIVLAVISFLFQLLPVFIAAMRGHPNTLAIAALSILLGWTCIGWIIALIWSLTAAAGHGSYYDHDRESDRNRRRRR